MGGGDTVPHSTILAWFRTDDLEFDRIKPWFGAVMDAAYQESHTTLYNCLCFTNICQHDSCFKLCFNALVFLLLEVLNTAWVCKLIPS